MFDEGFIYPIIERFIYLIIYYVLIVVNGLKAFGVCQHGNRYETD